MEQNNTTDKGFLMSQSAWDKLPLSQKAEMIKVAVKNGIYNLDTIRKEYNSLAESEKPSDDSYYSTMEKVAEENYKKWGFNTPDEALTHALNDNTYNYKGYYAKYPASKANADTHWTDEFKTVYHPTFSDESIYSGNVSEYNPQGLTGGHWEGETFIPAPWQKEHQYAKGGKKKTNASGKQAFLSTLDQSLQEDGRFNTPEWRRYFTELANVESGYSPNITNSIGAKGYFQLMPSNRSRNWTTPTQQFHEFYKFAGNNLDYLNKHLTKKDWERAKALGIDIFGLMAGAHLGGVGGVVRALRGQGNAKDSNGTSVMSYMTRFSQSGKGSPYLGSNFSSVPVVRDVSPMSTFTPEQYNLIYGDPFADNNSLFPFETPTIAPYVAPDYSNLFSEVTPSTVDTSVADAYSKEQLAKEERANRLNALNLILGNGLFGNPSDSSSNGLFDFALGDVASNPLMLVSSIYSNNNTFADGGPLVERVNSYPIGGPLTNALASVRQAINRSTIAASKAIINNSLNNMYQNTVGKYVFGNSSTEKPAANGALVGAKVGVPTTQVVNPDYTDLVDFLTADRNEGFLAEPTDIGDGKITIGSGLTNKKWLDLYKQRGNVWSKEDNRAAVLEEIKERSARLAKSLPNFNTLPLDSQKALISYDYNVGMSPNNHPNLWKAAKNKDWGTVANEMNATSKNPNFVKGLERRRKEEQDWFRRGFKAYGGNLYNDGGPTEEDDINLFRRNGNYFYQASPDSEEITVTPVNTLFDDPALWTFTDDNGRLYTPRKATPYTQSTITEKEDEGPLVEAAKNYLGELQYDINNGVPIGGKYTMPAIAVSALLPLAGEYIAGTSIAGIPTTTLMDTAIKAGFAGHGLNHLFNEGINGYGDAAMTALELAPLGELFKPMYQAGKAFVSPAAERARTPIITTENAASMTPEQWTAAQDAAIARGDMAEAQRLRDLHFKVSAPDTKVDVPLWSSSEEPFNSFDLSHFGETDNGFFGYGHYLTPIEKYAATYHPVNRKFYVNVKNPYTGSNDQYFNRVQYIKDRLARRKENVIRNLRDGKLTRLSKKLGINENTSLEDAEHLVDKYIADETVKWNDKYVKYVDEFEGKDGVLSWRDIQGIPNKREGIYKEVVVPRGEQIKSVDAVTYDDNGVRIPLGERDNFNINDIRYGLIPFLGLGAAGTLYGTSDR